MDAKARVVAWRYVDQSGYLRVSLDRNWHGTEETPLIPLTDHEAALAEERELRTSLESSWQQAEAQVFALIEKHAALLTGLEALAGECDGIEGLGSAVIAQRIRMLVSSVCQANELIDKSREKRVLAMAADLLDTHGATVAAIAVRTVAKNIDTLASAGLEGNRNSATNDGERNGL